MGLMRFLLAMAVVVSHIQPAHFALMTANIAVNVFFCISGFYMSLILTGKYHDRTTFYVNRYLRLYPVYLIVSLATWAWFLFAWMYVGHIPINSWIDLYEQMSWWQKLLLAISNWTMVGLDIPSLFHFKANAGFLFFHFYEPSDAPDGAKWAGEFRTIGQAWSIGVEIWFYLIAPFLVALRSRWILLIGLASLVLKIVMEKNGLLTYFFFPAQLCFFMAGMLLHRAYVAFRIEKVDWRIGFFVLMAVVVLFVFFDMLPKSVARYVIYVSFIPAIPVLFAVTRKNRFDINLGNLSYPIYIVHVLILSIAQPVLDRANINVHSNVFALAAVAFVLVASIILYVVIERPIDAFRQRRVTKLPPSQPESFQTGTVSSQSQA